MLTPIMKWIASVALLGNLLLLVFLGYHAVLQFLVAAAAAVVVFQAATMGEYRWMFALGVVACLFNPIEPIGFSAAPALVVNTVALLTVRTFLEAAQDAPAAFHCVHHRPHARQRVVMRPCEKQSPDSILFDHA